MRKVPALRACLRKSQNQLWVCEMKSPKIDFEVLQDVDWRSELELSCSKGFNSHTGPLWRAKLLSDSQSPCPIPEVRTNYPYQYKLILVTHLGLLGGTMNPIINALLLNLLNGGIIPDDLIAIREFYEGEKQSEMEEVKRRCKATHPRHLRTELENRLALNHRSLLAGAFEVSNNAEDATRLETSDIPLDTLQMIQKQCRSRGMTVNSFMMAVLNTAIVQMLKATGINKESYNVVSCHAVDGRRYLKGDVSNIQETFTFTLTHLKVTPGNVMDIFWKYAMVLHSELHYRVSHQQPVYEGVIKEERKQPKASYDDYYVDQPLTDYDYYFSNISKTSNLFSGEGEIVQLTQIDIANGVHKQGIPLFVILDTFRNRSRLTITYSTKHMAKDTVQKLLATSSEVIRHALYQCVGSSHL